MVEKERAMVGINVTGMEMEADRRRWEMKRVVFSLFQRGRLELLFVLLLLLLILLLLLLILLMTVVLYETP